MSPADPARGVILRMPATEPTIARVFRRVPPPKPDPPVYAQDLRNVNLALLDILEQVHRIRRLLEEDDDGEEEADPEP